VVVVSSTWSVGATPGVVTVVELEEVDDCAKPTSGIPTPDISVRVAVAIMKVLNITRLQGITGERKPLALLPELIQAG